MGVANEASEGEPTHRNRVALECILSGCSYLEGVLAADVVLRFHRGNDIAGQGNATQNCLLSTICEQSTNVR